MGKQFELPMEKDGERIKLSFTVSFPGEVRAVVFNYHFSLTKRPKSLPCSKRRRGIECILCKVVNRDGEEYLVAEDHGYSFCRPPDKFDMRMGCTLAFQRAVRVFAVLHDIENAAAILWSEFLRSKGWRRINVVK